MSSLGHIVSVLELDPSKSQIFLAAFASSIFVLPTPNIIPLNAQFRNLNLIQHLDLGKFKFFLLELILNLC